MGLCGSHKEDEDVAKEIQTLGTDDIVIPEFVARVIPDCGEYFLRWLGVGGPALDEVAAHVNALRGEHGWIGLDETRRFGFGDYKQGPLTFLSMMTGQDVSSSVWASHGLRGADKRAVEGNFERVLRGKGHAAAAAWAIAARPGSDHNLGLVLEGFAGSLLSSWEKQLDLYYPRHVRKAFKKWRR